MQHITIIVPDGQTSLSSVACIVGAYEMFSIANEYWKESGRKQLYKVELAGISKRTHFNDGLLTVNIQTHISAINKTNLILIPSLVRDFQRAMKGNKLLVDWIANQYKEGAEIAS